MVTIKYLSDKLSFEFITDYSIAFYTSGSFYYVSKLFSARRLYLNIYNSEAKKLTFEEFPFIITSRVIEKDETAIIYSFTFKTYEVEILYKDKGIETITIKAENDNEEARAIYSLLITYIVTNEIQ